MSTIPEPFYNRLANASITREDGAMLIGFLELLDSGIDFVDRVASSPVHHRVAMRLRCRRLDGAGRALRGPDRGREVGQGSRPGRRPGRQGALPAAELQVPPCPELRKRPSGRRLAATRQATGTP